MTERKLRVLIIPELFPVSKEDWRGVFHVDFARALSEVADVTVWHTRPWGIFAGHRMDEDFGFPTYRTYMWHFHKRVPKPFAYFWWHYNALRKAGAMGEFDLIHAHGSALHGMLARDLSRILKIPYFLTEHTGPFDQLVMRHQIRKRVFSAMHDAAMVMAPSKWQADTIVKCGAPLERICVSGNPINTDFFKPDSKPLRDYVLFVGRLDIFKGALTALKAFHQKIEVLHPLQFVIAGEGEQSREIHQYIEQNQLQDFVVRLPMQDRRSMRDLMQHAAIVVNPSKHESFGLVGAEALACGTPIITDIRTGPAEYYDSRYVREVHYGEVDEIGDAMVSLWSERADMRPEEMHQFIQDKFSYPVFAERILSKYQKAISS